MTAELLWQPGSADWTDSRIGRFMTWLNAERGLQFADYQELHRWSISDLDGFWSAIWEYFEVRSPYDAVLGKRSMPGAEWFPGALLNYAEHALRFAATDTDAVIGYSQTRDVMRLSWDELRDQVGRARAGLQRLGVGRGDRVAAYLPNIPETVVAFLATASLGAIWASCAPEFGPRSVVERFAQIEPKILLVVSGYQYGDKSVDRREQVDTIRAGLPTLDHVVAIPYGAGTLADTVAWGNLLSDRGELTFDQVSFAHPLYVLFTSGTTGKPKAIVHCHGGILVEHLKNLALSWDLGPGDRMLWFTTTAWMMWNALISALLVGATPILIDGNPTYPDLRWQWQLASETQATFMGASPGFLMACRQTALHPAAEFDLSALRQLAVAGSPLPAAGYRWATEELKVLLNVGTGGTDICSGILQGSRLQPVWAGEISGPCLGVDAQAYDDNGHPATGRLGELVIARPMPSMPVGFWGDHDDARYRDTYFTPWPGIWRHGDWVRIAPSGRAVVTGRSDATLNRGGIRLGTADFYQLLEELPQIADTLIVHLEDPTGAPGDLHLYVALQEGHQLDDDLRHHIATLIRTQLSPRHLPDHITAVPAIPRNRTGKKLELPVKRILLGAEPTDVASLDTLADPTALCAFVELRTKYRT